MNIAFLVLSKYQNNNYKDIFLKKYYLNTDDGKLTHINDFEKIYLKKYDFLYINLYLKSYFLLYLNSLITLKKIYFPKK